MSLPALATCQHQVRVRKKEHLPASFRTLRFVQYLIIIANGRMRSSISTYVRIMRVFSKANVLLTFMSHASRSSGSQIFTMGTFAWETHTTRSMPSAQMSAVSRRRRGASPYASLALPPVNTRAPILSRWW